MENGIDSQCLMNPGFKVDSYTEAISRREIKLQISRTVIVENEV